MDCLCGKKMKSMGKTKSGIKIWACNDGCGRLFLEADGFEVGGTWYLAEKNDMKGGLY